MKAILLLVMLCMAQTFKPDLFLQKHYHCYRMTDTVPVTIVITQIGLSTQIMGDFRSDTLFRATIMRVDSPEVPDIGFEMRSVHRIASPNDRYYVWRYSTRAGADGICGAHDLDTGLAQTWNGYYTQINPYAQRPESTWDFHVEKYPDTTLFDSIYTDLYSFQTVAKPLTLNPDPGPKSIIKNNGDWVVLFGLYYVVGTNDTVPTTKVETRTSMTATMFSNPNIGILKSKWPMNIVSIDGKVICRNRQSITLPLGVYIVRSNNRTQKIVVMR